MNSVLHREAAPWIERLARPGYASKGLVYAIIGFLAAAAGLGIGGKTADKNQAFKFILHQPFGHFILFILALGLAGYAVWRVISGIRDTEHRGSDAKGFAVRMGGMLRGLFYGWIAIEVLRLAMTKSAGGSGGDAQTRHWTARLMDKPFGHWMVILLGLGVFGYGIYQIYRAWKGKLGKQVHIPSGMMTNVSRFGLASRGVVFLIIGGSFVFAGKQGDPGEARGTSGALRELASQPFGHVLLTLMGLGLVSYGIYAFLQAKYRRIEA